jgi:fatty acid desaturase
MGDSARILAVPNNTVQSDSEASAEAKAPHYLTQKLRLKHRLTIQELMNNRTSAFEGLAALSWQLFLLASSAVFASMVSSRIEDISIVHSVMLYGITTLFIGSRFRALGNMLHECSHGTFVRGPKLNMILGHLLAFIDFTDFEVYRREHMSHHRHIGDPVLDLDFINRSELSLLLSAHFIFGWSNFLMFYIIPYVTVYQIFRYWSDAFDHAGITDSQQDFHRTRNHLFGWQWLNLLVFPRNDQYHLVHHLFPGLPTKAFPQAHLKLMEAEPEYAKRDHNFGFIEGTD